MAYIMRNKDCLYDISDKTATDIMSSIDMERITDLKEKLATIDCSIYELQQKKKHKKTTVRIRL